LIKDSNQIQTLRQFIPLICNKQTNDSGQNCKNLIFVTQSGFPLPGPWFEGGKGEESCVKRELSVLKLLYGDNIKVAVKQCLI
jgi:hypothetical protein